MDNVIEFSAKTAEGGRVPIKIVLLKIHDDPDETNKNGIHWKEKYIKNAKDTAECMPICASFIDDDKTVPFDHGLTGEVVENNLTEPVFTDSESVGVIEHAEIENVVINGEVIRAFVGYGYLFKQRYPNFVQWIRKNYSKSKVDTSIEIMGTKQNRNKIIYEEKNPTSKFRTPKEFCFTSTCIISVAPADENAVVLEVAQKNKSSGKEKDKDMDCSLNDIKDAVRSVISDTNDYKASYEKQISDLNAELKEKDEQLKECQTAAEEKDNELTALKAELEETQKTVADLQQTLDAYKGKEAALQEEIEKLNAEKQIEEMEKALSDYTDEEKKYAETEINEFRQNPLKGDIQSIISKICVGIVSKRKTAEINSENEPDAIFSELYIEPMSDSDADTNIF